MTMNSKNKPALRTWLKWAALGGVSAINGYATILMYARAEYAFALLTLILTALGVYVFARKSTYAHRYIYPGVAGMILFIIFPLVYTVGLSFTNYSGSNQLSFQRAQSVLMEQSFQTGESYSFSLYGEEGSYQLALNTQDGWYLSDPIDLKALPESLNLSLAQQPSTEAAPLKTVIQNRQQLSALVVSLPNGDHLTMSGLRKFAASQSLFALQDDGETLINQQTKQVYKPNWETGYYQEVNEAGQFIGESMSPGFIVNSGWDNFTRIFTDPGIQGPFVSIFIWTILFSALTVVFTLAVGVVLAQVVSWEALKGRGLYRVLLILPYAVPAFISILIFKGLFNQSFGEINQVLQGLFGLSPAWFTDPFLAKTMILIVNTWLGYPYMMILAMGLLKAIPDDLYEASAMDGAGPLDNFFRITLPMLVKPMVPLLIASFAFNFNNFVLIQLLTNGAPDMLGTSVPAGHTDLLVSYTYRIAFEGAGGQDFGLAGAIATLIFLLVGGLSLLNMKFTKLDAE
ncbi:MULTISPECIES: maltose ABC transporter permease MalF [Photobacterium]|uniref:Maltose/maltodextrin transport system permease protein n=1 Tax=Photobacterium halotolerans TaxID=265726 RepID=A0A0F5VCF7_9GAMM|nr:MULTISPECIES: maltose ABC transporter permease MalF [Photobacterium]KKC99154.1 maltose transporter membrane protein [Photobacterium halotolerans]UIP30723.1 maltose ABC transporter permease MalF [Photobacterium sp. TLY01]